MAGKKRSDNRLESGEITRYPVLKVRLYPTAEQAALLEKTFGCCRYLWNQMLSDVQEFYAATDLHYIPTPAKYKRSAPFLAEVDSQALCAVHQNLRKAFLNYFKAPKRFHYPRFKTKKAQKDAFTVYCRPYRTGPSICLTKSGLRMPKLGVLKAKIHRRPARNWELRCVTVMKTRSGKYFCSLVFRCVSAVPKAVIPTPERTLGINYSFTHFYTDSAGNYRDVPAYITRSKEKLSRLQQKLSRMRRGSKNYEKQLQRIRLLHERIANQRRDFVHKESRRIANAWDAVCVRQTDLATLSRKVKFSGAADSGFGMFRECLKYKLEILGKHYLVVDRYALTAKTCHACGAVHEGLANGERKWICPHCGAALTREINAAQNIRDWGFAQLDCNGPAVHFNQETGVLNAVS